MTEKSLIFSSCRETLVYFSKLMKRRTKWKKENEDTWEVLDTLYSYLVLLTARTICPILFWEEMCSKTNNQKKSKKKKKYTYTSQALTREINSFVGLYLTCESSVVPWLNSSSLKLCFQGLLVSCLHNLHSYIRYGNIHNWKIGRKMMFFKFDTQQEEPLYYKTGSGVLSARRFYALWEKAGEK